MSAVVLIILAIVIFIVAYLTYGRYLAKSWGIDPKRPTPAHTMEDGVDYVPAKTPVLMGHHFSSIAGAGPVNGPIQAAFFGWVPCFLWIVIGGIFFGAVQDFGSLFISIRHEGKSLGEVIEATIGRKARVLFTVFAWLVLLLVIAAFADIVANSFIGASYGGSTSNGSVATASLLFIPLAICFGFVVYRKNAPIVVSSIVGVILLAACVGLGLAFPLNVPKGVWIGFVFVYIIIASVTPVWILLQPRDYLSSFLLYFMMIAAIIGIIGATIFDPASTQFSTPAFTGFSVGGSFLFPTLFITIACGAVSGFHSLIASGTTSKQLDNEKDALLVGYGSMLIECVLAVISLIAIGTLSVDGTQASVQAALGLEAISPTIIFGTAISNFFAVIGLPAGAVEATKTIIMLAVSCFCLTSLDTGTRLGRFMFQELFATSKSGEKNILSNMYVATIITAICGFVLCLAGYTKVWPLFGAANQLVAVPAFLAIATYLKKVGRNNKMLYFPIIFMACATITSLILTFKNNLMSIINQTAEGTALFTCVLQDIIIVPLVILAIILIVDGGKVLIKKEEAAQAE
ncbi:MAG: carbon starvation protein A [Lachnospiraceae bacterium]|nr:carbon starvation protein A [Lachnospiraceae bacterium]